MLQVLHRSCSISPLKEFFFQCHYWLKQAWGAIKILTNNNYYAFLDISHQNNFKLFSFNYKYQKTSFRILKSISRDTSHNLIIIYSMIVANHCFFFLDWNKRWNLIININANMKIYTVNLMHRQSEKNQDFLIVVFFFKFYWILFLFVHFYSIYQV